MQGEEMIRKGERERRTTNASDVVVIYNLKILVRITNKIHILR